MPTRLFDSLDVVNIVEGYISGPTIYHNSGILTTTNFGNFQISGNGSASGVPGEFSQFQGLYRKAGSININSFPAIPPNALITRIQTKLGISISGTATADANPATLCEAAVIIAADCGLYGVKSISSDDIRTQHAAASGSASQAANFIDQNLGSPYWTYDQLFASGFINLVFSLNINVLGSGSAAAWAGTTDFTAAISNLQIEITYTAGPFSWYLQIHTATIGGKPSVVVDDIVAVDNDTTPPANSTFYGTGENFPTRADIPLYYWYDPISFTILYQPIRPYLGWLLQLVNFVGDSTGALQFDMALESIIVLMTDPSGIYTLVEGQRHDTLYERFVGVPSINVKIPDPFAKTGFVP